MVCFFFPSFSLESFPCPHCHEVMKDLDHLYLKHKFDCRNWPKEEKKKEESSSLKPGKTHIRSKSSTNTIYVCGSCKVKLHSYDDLKIHEEGCKADKVQCAWCKKFFDGLPALLSHEEVCKVRKRVKQEQEKDEKTEEEVPTKKAEKGTKKEDIKCSDCGKMVSSYSELFGTHVQSCKKSSAKATAKPISISAVEPVKSSSSHSDVPKKKHFVPKAPDLSKPLLCKECGKELSSFAEMYGSHRDMCQGKQDDAFSEVECSKCKEIFPDYSALFSHESKCAAQHKKREHTAAVKCNDCGTMVDSYSELYGAHQSVCKKSNTSPVPMAAPLLCKECGQEVSSYSEMYGSHRDVCDSMRSRTTKKDSLAVPKTHKKAASEGNVACPRCDKRLSSYSELYGAHQSYCGMTKGKSPGLADTKQKKQEKEKDYHCPHCKEDQMCDAAYKIHMDICKGPPKCGVCGKVFDSMQEALTHWKEPTICGTGVTIALGTPNNNTSHDTDSSAKPKSSGFLGFLEKVGEKVYEDLTSPSPTSGVTHHGGSSSHSRNYREGDCRVCNKRSAKRNCKHCGVSICVMCETSGSCSACRGMSSNRAKDRCSSCGGTSRRIQGSCNKCGGRTCIGCMKSRGLCRSCW